jgi:hypothetical protein
MTTPIYIEIKWYNICDAIIISTLQIIDQLEGMYD